MARCPKCATVLHKLHKSIGAFDIPEFIGYDWAPRLYLRSGHETDFHVSFFCPRCHHKFPFTTEEEVNKFLPK